MFQQGPQVKHCSRVDRALITQQAKGVPRVDFRRRLTEQTISEYLRAFGPALVSATDCSRLLL